MQKNRTVFWDRDGVLNEVVRNRSDGQQNVSPFFFHEFTLIEDAILAVRESKNKGYLNIVVTKQPDIARNKLSLDELKQMHDLLRKKIPELDAFYVCPHDDSDNCNCRKPKPGLLFQAARDFNIDLSQSYMVGDSQSDIDAAHNAGPVKAILIKTSYNGGVKNFNLAVDTVMEVPILLS